MRGQGGHDRRRSWAESSSDAAYGLTPRSPTKRVQRTLGKTSRSRTESEERLVLPPYVSSRPGPLTSSVVVDKPILGTAQMPSAAVVVARFE